MAKVKSDDFLDELEEQFPELVEKKEEISGYISTGSLSLDVSIGVKGIPLGKYTEIYGAESSGKTTLALSLCKNALETGHKVLYIDVEHGVSLERVGALVGQKWIDSGQMILVKPETMEQALKVAEMAINSGQFNLIVLDSIAAMAPEKVKKGEISDSDAPAIVARMFGRFITRNASTIHTSSLAFVGLNQVRDKFGVTFLKMYETPGGHQWKHMASVRISLGKVSDIKRGDAVVGIQAKFVVKKNKVSAPFRSYTFPIMFDIGVDTYRDVVDFAKTMGVLVKKGPYLTFEGEVLANGVVNTVEYLKEHKDTLDKIKETCYTLTKQVPIVEKDEEDYEQETDD